MTDHLAKAHLIAQRALDPLLYDATDLAQQARDIGAGVTALLAENEYLRQTLRQARDILAQQRDHCSKNDVFTFNKEARRTLEFGLTHAGEGK